MVQLNDIEKLRRLIPHWIEHNQTHAAEFLRWAQVAREAGQEQPAAMIENAAALLHKAETDLRAALEKAGGAIKTQNADSQHHHSHEA